MNIFVLVYRYGTFILTFQSPQPQLLRNLSHRHFPTTSSVHSSLCCIRWSNHLLSCMLVQQDCHTKNYYFYECTPFLATTTSISGSFQAAKVPNVTQKKKEMRRELLLQFSTREQANPSEYFLFHYKYLKLSASWH